MSERVSGNSNDSLWRRARGVANGGRPLCCARVSSSDSGGSGWSGGLDVKLIVGLGNPGQRYARTRHNVGFDAVDVFASRHGWSLDTRRHRSLIATGALGAEKLLLAKPQTY